MSKKDTRSFVRYHNLDGSYWAPTIDLSYYLHDPRKEASTDLLVEETFHRYLTLNTLTELDMGWEEALTSIEMMRILDLARSLCSQDDDFCLQVPLERTLEHNIGVMDFKKATLMITIRDLVRASEIIQLYEESCEALIEPLTLRMLDGFLQIPKTRALFKQVRQIKFSRSTVFQKNYFRIKKQFPGKGDIKTFCAIAACVLDVKSNESIPPLSVNTSFDYFNEEKAEKIGERFLHLTGKKPKKPISTEEEVYDLTGQIGLEYSSFEESSKKVSDYINSECVFPQRQRFVFAPVNMLTCYRAVNHPINKPLLDKLKHTWAKAANKPPHLRLISGKDWKRPEFERSFKILGYLGTPSISVAENIASSAKYVTFREGLSLQIVKDLIKAVQLTSLKYFMLSGEADCPFVPLSPEKSCILTDLINGSKIVPKNFTPCNECIVAEMLRNINIKIDRNP